MANDDNLPDPRLRHRLDIIPGSEKPETDDVRPDAGIFPENSSDTGKASPFDSHKKRALTSSSFPSGLPENPETGPVRMHQKLKIRLVKLDENTYAPCLPLSTCFVNACLTDRPGWTGVPDENGTYFIVTPDGTEIKLKSLFESGAYTPPDPKAEIVDIDLASKYADFWFFGRKTHNEDRTLTQPDKNEEALRIRFQDLLNGHIRLLKNTINGGPTYILDIPVDLGFVAYGMKKTYGKKLAQNDKHNLTGLLIFAEGISVSGALTSGPTGQSSKPFPNNKNDLLLNANDIMCPVPELTALPSPGHDEMTISGGPS